MFVSATIALFRASYEQLTGEILRAAGVRRRAVLVGTATQRDRLRSGLGAAQAGIEYEFVGELDPDASDDAIFAVDDLDDVIVADMGISEERLLEIVDAAHKRAVKVRIAPRTTELLVERGEYVPGLGVPLFELRPPIFAGADWTLKRSFDLVVSALIVVVGLPVWVVIAAAIKLTSRGPVFYADPRVGLSEQEFRMLKFRTMVADADRQQEQLERANEATGALFKIRRDPRVTSVGRVLRRFSLDEVPNVINVLRGQMSLVGPGRFPFATTSGSKAGIAAATTSCLASPASGRSVGAPISRSTISCDSTSTTSRTGRSGSTSRFSSVPRRRS